MITFASRAMALDFITANRRTEPTTTSGVLSGNTCSGNVSAAHRRLQPSAHAKNGVRAEHVTGDGFTAHRASEPSPAAQKGARGGVSSSLDAELATASGFIAQHLVEPRAASNGARGGGGRLLHEKVTS